MNQLPVFSSVRTTPTLVFYSSHVNVTPVGVSARNIVKL